MTNNYWEYGERVPAYDPRDHEEEDLDRADSPAITMLRNFVSILKSCHDPALSIECLCLISGACYDGISMADIARRHMVSRAAVSRRCVDLCRLLGIPPTRAMRNESGQNNARKARIDKIKEEIEQ